MLRENEVVMLILGVGVLLFIIINRSQVMKITSWKILISGYCILLAGWFSTVFEAVFMERLLNVIEHISYLVSALLVLIWFRKASSRSNAEETI